MSSYEMQFTPLLPSQLLVGSPFNPGTPAGTQFSSAQFASFPNSPIPIGLGFTHHHSHPALQRVPPHITSSTGLAPGPNATDSYAAYMAVTAANSQGTANYYRQNLSLGGSGLGVIVSGSGQLENESHAYHHHHHHSHPHPHTRPSMSMNMGMNMGMGIGIGVGSPHMVHHSHQPLSRTIYLGNVPAETTAEELLSHVRSGIIESVRLIPEKNCGFISFLDHASAVHFHSDAILKKLTILNQDIKVGWGKPSIVPPVVSMAVQQEGASRNVYLGSLPENMTEGEIREELSAFGPIDMIKLIPEKNIAFVHFWSISTAIKAVQSLSQNPQWAQRKVYYGKDRCAYISKTQQQNAAQYLGLSPGYEHLLAQTDRDLLSSAISQQSAAAVAVAVAGGGAENVGNRTVYLGNVHPDSSIEEICNVIRGGLLHNIRYIAEKHICFVTFVDSNAAAQFFAMANLQGLSIHNKRLKIGWGKHSGPLPNAIALAVTAGASRNVYIGNIDSNWLESKLRTDFSEFGEIEQINFLKEKSCAFVNFTNIANAIKAIEGIKQKPEYAQFKVNFGKDRCGNRPRTVTPNNGNSNNNFNQDKTSDDGEDIKNENDINELQTSESDIQFTNDSATEDGEEKKSSPIVTTSNHKYSDSADSITILSPEGPDNNYYEAYYNSNAQYSQHEELKDSQNFVSYHNNHNHSSFNYHDSQNTMINILAGSLQSGNSGNEVLNQYLSQTQQEQYFHAVSVPEGLTKISDVNNLDNSQEIETQLGGKNSTQQSPGKVKVENAMLGLAIS